MQAWAAQNAEKGQAKKLTEHSSPETPKFSAFASSFASSLLSVNSQNSYHLRDTWILDSGANLHICKNRSRFRFGRLATANSKLIAGKSSYAIEAFRRVV